ncbi:WXG100 family type VII secretion target [Kitasatospora cathayae]|uniref:PPE domain-containing protein n=1 Tax=Kitasatospora cathayae TaxID=3004092 RepID=A0ABY7Q8Y3_9ACTN|nr:hypothetical protein [Kitasatospora sp. HUAS 3-15]WBP88644.1 hypothetical protein O1G21_24265 [Kitasatospora sp. HUAS 3-15]
MVYTDFTKYSHADLRKMAQALDPGAVMAAGDPWRKAATTLKEIRKTLTTVSTEAAGTWEGTTSDSFHTSMLTLAASINEAAAYANDAANTLHNMSEAMATAKRDMPEEPGNWDKFKDTVGDVFSTEDDHIQLTDRKKAEAAAVMQTLAMHYRIATPALKAPTLNLKPAKRGDPDKTSQDDSSGAAAAVAAMVSGTSFGSGGTSVRSAVASAPQRSRASAPSVVSSPPSRSASTPTDPGIKGGRAQAPSKPSTAASSSSGAGISGTPVSRPSGSVPSPVTSGTQTSGLSTTSVTGLVTGPITGGGGQPTVSPVGPTVQTAPVGPGFGQGKTGFGDKGFPSSSTPLEGSGPRGGRAASVGGGGEIYPGVGAGGRGTPGAKQVGGSLAKPGGAVRETAPPGGGARGKQAFTEGGSGLGARGRLGAEPGARSSGIMSPGIPMSEAQRRKKDHGKDGERPDYLVEDEETWASDKSANPNVVE